MIALPDEVEALQDLLTESRLARQALEAEIRSLRQQIASLERAQAQRSTIARPAGTQLEFALERDGAVLTDREGPDSAAARDRRLPSLVRERVILEPAPGDGGSSCPSCSGPLEAAGSDVSELLEYRGGEYRLIEYLRPKTYCAACRMTLQAPPPPRPIPRAVPGPGLLAHVLAARYERQLPLYRQHQIYATAGISADRSTLADWIEASWLLLEPLVDALARQVLGGSHLHTSNRVYPIRAHGTGRTRTGRLWLYLRDERVWGSPVPPAACFRFTADRSGAHARAHLAGFTGTLQGPALDEEPIYHTGRIQLLACWAELRARIGEARDLTVVEMAEELLRGIDALYEIERSIFGRSVEERRAIRRERSQPLLEALRVRLRECLRELPKKAALSATIRFALAHWKRFERYTADGRAQMDGLDAQQLLMDTVGERLGRGTDTHGARAAGLYGLIATARLNGIDPEHYLRAVLEQISVQMPSNWAALLPWALAPT